MVKFPFKSPKAAIGRQQRVPFCVTTVNYTDSPSDSPPPLLLLPDVGFSLLGFSTPLIYPLHRLPLAAGLTQIVFAVILCFPTLQTGCSVPTVFGVFTHFASLFFHPRRGAREFAFSHLIRFHSLIVISFAGRACFVIDVFRFFLFIHCAFSAVSRILLPSFLPSSCVADSFVKKEFRVPWK